MVQETNPSIDLSNIQDGLLRDEDAALVTAVQKGDLAAFERLVTRHQKRMLNIAFRLIGDYDDACEVVQDSFLAAYKNIQAFRGDSKFTTWLTTITLNLSKNRLKQRSIRYKREALSLDEPVETDDGRMTIEHPSQAPSALDGIMKRDVKTQVQECIKKLDHGFREVLVLRDMQEFSYEEIANILKMRSGTVKSRLFRARDMVKDCLKKTLGDF